MFKILKKINEQMSNNMNSSQLDELLAEICNFETSFHPDHEFLAARVLVSRLHKYRGICFSEKMQLCFDNTTMDKQRKRFSLIKKQFNDVVQYNAEELNKLLNYRKDYTLRYASQQTLMKSYLLKEGGFGKQ